MGARRSLLITVKLHEDDFPDASVAVSVTSVSPDPFRIVPDAGDCTILIDDEGETSSLTDAINV
jgi:hypothetical protein